MFRWCAYCWSFMGEREPLEDLSLTHGICSRCVDAGAIAAPDVSARARPFKEFHARLTEVATAGRVEDVDDILERGAQLGLGPIDLLVGVMQPALYQAGRLWQSGQISPRDEARLTRFCEAVLDVLSTQQRERIAAATGQPIFLLSAGGNSHNLGLKMLAFVLREAGRHVHVFEETPSEGNLCMLASLMKPASIGVSVALAEQLDYVRKLADALARHGLTPRVLVGGGAISDSAVLPSSVVRWTSSDNLLTAPRVFA